MASIFGEILQQLLGELPAAHSAVFVDWEGEAIDQASSLLGVTDTRLVGAHWGVIYYLARSMFERLKIGAPRQIILTFESERVCVRRIGDEYFVVVVSGPDAPLSATLRALDRAETKLHSQI